MSKVIYSVESFENEPSTLYVSKNRSDAERVNSQIELLDALFFLDGEARLAEVQSRTFRRRGRANPSDRFGMSSSKVSQAIESAKEDIATILKISKVEVPATLDEARGILLPREGTPLYSDRAEGARKNQELMSLYTDIGTLEDLLSIKAIATSLSEETFEKRTKQGTRQFCIDHNIIERLLAAGVGLSRDNLKRLGPNPTFDSLDINTQDAILSALSFTSMFVRIEANEGDAFLGLGPFQALAVMPIEARNDFFKKFENISMDSDAQSYGAHSFAPIVYALYISAELGTLSLRRHTTLESLFSAISPEIKNIVLKFQDSSFTLASATAAISALRANEPLSNEDFLQGLLPALNKLLLIDQEDVEDALELLPENACRVVQGTFLATIFNHLPVGSLTAISTNNGSKLRGNFGVTSLQPFATFAQSIVGKLPAMGRVPSDNAMFRDYLEVNNTQLVKTNFAHWTFEAMFQFSMSNSKIQFAGKSAAITDAIKANQDLIDTVVKDIVKARKNKDIRAAARNAYEKMVEHVIAGWDESDSYRGLSVFNKSINLEPFFTLLKSYSETNGILPLFREINFHEGELSFQIDFQVCYALGFIVSLSVEESKFKNVSTFRMRNVTRNLDTTLFYYESVPFNPLSLFAGLSPVGSCCVKPGDAGVTCAVSAYLAPFDANVIIYARDDVPTGDMVFKDSRKKKTFTGIAGIYTSYGIKIDPAEFSKSLKDNLEISTDISCAIEFGATEINLNILDMGTASEQGLNVLNDRPFSTNQFRMPDNLEPRGYGVPFRSSDEFRERIYVDYFANCTVPYEAVIANLDDAFQASQHETVQDLCNLQLKSSPEGIIGQSTATYTDNHDRSLVARSSFGFTNNVNLSTMTQMHVNIISEDNVKVVYSNDDGHTLDTIETTLPVLRYMFSWPKGSNFMLTNGHIKFDCTPSNLMGEDCFKFIVSNLMFPSWFKDPLGDITYRHMVNMRFPKNGLTVNGETIDQAEARDLY